MEKGTAAQTLSEHFFLEFYQFLDLDALGSTPIDYFAVFVALKFCHCNSQLSCLYSCLRMSSMSSFIPKRREKDVLERL